MIEEARKRGTDSESQKLIKRVHCRKEIPLSEMGEGQGSSRLGSAVRRVVWCMQIEFVGKNSHQSEIRFGRKALPTFILYFSFSALFLSSLGTITVHAGCKDHGFLQQKLTVPYINIQCWFCSSKNWPYIRDIWPMISYPWTLHALKCFKQSAIGKVRTSFC